MTDSWHFAADIVFLLDARYKDGQLKTFFVGGPNSRKDFHMEEGEERYPHSLKYQKFMPGDPGGQALGCRAHKIAMVTTFAYVNRLHCITPSSDDFETVFPPSMKFSSFHSAITQCSSNSAA
ncbi:hypothetical protein TNCV_3669641 [Trichonephila clavipes]|nr:hypothetical protein TNCV_3669641 [Trichonephila clavipes]